MFYLGRSLVLMDEMIIVSRMTCFEIPTGRGKGRRDEEETRVTLC